MNRPLNYNAIYESVIAELREQGVGLDFDTPIDLAKSVAVAQTRWLDTRKEAGDTRRAPAAFVLEEIRVQVAALKQQSAKV